MYGYLFESNSVPGQTKDVGMGTFFPYWQNRGPGHL